MRYIHAVTVVLAALCTPAWAINKCTLADSKVVYQDAACDTKSKTIEQVKTWDSTGKTGTTAEVWQYSRQKDSMTGREICFAISPSVLTGYRGVNSGFAHVWVQIAMNAAGLVALTVRTSEASNDLFHNDISGMGVKVDEKEFMPFSRKVTAHALGFSDTSTGALLSQLEGGNHIRMRLGFWPYEKLHDAPPISLIGFKPALAQAKECTKK